MLIKSSRGESLRAALALHTLLVIRFPAILNIVPWFFSSLSSSSATCLKPWSPPPGRRRPCSRGTWEPLGELTNPSRLFLPFLKSYRIYISITSMGFDYSELHLVVRNSNTKSSPGIHWSSSMISRFPLCHSLLYCSLFGRFSSVMRFCAWFSPDWRSRGRCVLGDQLAASQHFAVMHQWTFALVRLSNFVFTNWQGLNCFFAK